MTTYCVANTGDNSDGSTWAKAKTSIEAALAIPVVAGDIIQVSNVHTLTKGSAITYTPPAGGIAIISVTPSGGAGFSAFTAGATEAVGAAAAGLAFAGAANSSMYCYGLDLAGGTTANTASNITFLNTSTTNSKVYLDTCTLRLPSTNTATPIAFGPSGAGNAKASFVTILNSTFIIGSRSGLLLSVRSEAVEIINPTFTFGATKPSPLIVGVTGSTTVGSLIIRDGTIATFTGAALIDVSTADTLNIIFKNLTISATPTLKTGTWNQGNGSILLLNTDSGDTTYTFQYETAYGSLVAEITDFVTTGGAQFNGAPIAWKIITTSVASEFSPFVLPNLNKWSTSTGAQTSAIEFAQVNGATALNDRQIWSSIEFPASASLPNYTFQTNRNAQPFLGTGTAVTTSTNPWTVPNIGASPVTQKLQNAFTAAETGLVASRISIGVATLTMWINPALDGVS